MKKYLVTLIMLLPSTGFTSSIDLNLSDEAFRIIYASHVDRKLVSDMGLLYLEKKGRFRDDEIALHAGLNAVSGAVRIGGRAFFATPGNAEALAIGFGGQARAALSKWLGLGGHFYYAPEVTSWLDAKGYYEFSVRLDFKASNSAFLYLGYRKVTLEIGSRSNEVELNDDVILGFKLFM